MKNLHFGKTAVIKITGLLVLALLVLNLAPAGVQHFSCFGHQ